jgi:2-iminobutanoate/2-iminopropanoate deaminase
MEVLRPAGLTPVGPYSPAVRVGPWVFLSGQIALNEQGELVRTTLEAEIAQVLTNLKAVLKAANLEPRHLVKVSIFLTDMAFFPMVNAEYEKLFPDGRYPARETVAVAALPKGARIEISGIAYDPRG